MEQGVVDRDHCVHRQEPAREGRDVEPRGGRVELTQECQAFRGVLATKFIVCRPADPEAKGLIERDFARVRPTERGFDFLSDLQELFLAD